MQKETILIISQTIFPAQSPRSHRATELAKEFARQGYDVTLYAVLGKYDYREFEQETSIKIKNIGNMLFSKTNSEGTDTWSIFDRLLIKIFRKFLEFPDIELMFKIPGIIKKEKNADCLITIAIPYTLHWGAALAKSLYPKRFPKTWIADCGDPYMGNKFVKPYLYFKYIERWFCKKANYITVPFEGAREGYYQEYQNKIKVIPQGFNFDDVLTVKSKIENPITTFAYAGSFYIQNRDPSLFLEYLASLKEDFTFIIYTNNNFIVEPFIKRLGKKLEIKGFIPRKELLEALCKTDFLVNFENGNNIHSPSKLIDYALTGRPVLSINPKEIQKETFEEFLKRDYTNRVEFKNIEEYNIKNVADKFISLCD